MESSTQSKDQHKVQAITTHIDILARGISELKSRVAFEVKDVSPNDDRTTQNSVEMDSKQKWELQEMKTLQNICSVLNSEITNLANSQLTLMKKCKELEEHVGKLEEENNEMRKQLLLIDVTTAEQEMRLQVI